MGETKWADDVLSFWFGELTFDDWFAVKAETDATVTTRFATLWDRMQEAIPSIAFREPGAALAATIALDQFPRNMFRKSAKAFSSDPLALAVAYNALNRGFDAGMAQERRPFIYMPFMHSESLADQEHCVTLFGGPGDERAKYAVEHRDIIRRFGRFPHRNKALGRQSTEAEVAFLAGHEGFGQ